MSWDVEYTDQFEEWWNDLTAEEQDAIVAAEEFLEDHGPALGRPFVDTVKASRHANMKELRPTGGNIRILFAERFHERSQTIPDPPRPGPCRP